MTTPIAESEVAYVYDGTVEGLLSAIFAAYANHENPSDVVTEDNLQLRLDQRERYIDTNPQHADRVRRGISRTCGESAFEAVKNASLADSPDAGTIAYRFVRYAMASSKPNDCKRCKYQGTCMGVCKRPTNKGVLGELTHPEVEPLIALSRAVMNERHAMLEFIRFKELEGGLWYAQCNPRHSVVPLIMDWFSARFNTQAFIIYDEVHHIAGVYEGKGWYLVKADAGLANNPLYLPTESANEKAMSAAWRRFYDTVAIDSRYNPELRRQFLPKRYWKNLTEMDQRSAQNDFTRSINTRPCRLPK